MCSPVRVLKPSHQPSNQFTASCCSGPAVLCGLKKDSLSKRCNLLFEHLALNALMSCHADMKRRQGPCCTPHKPFQDSAVEADRRTNLSFCEVLDCTNLSLNGLVRSLDAAVVSYA